MTENLNQPYQPKIPAKELKQDKELTRKKLEETIKMIERAESFLVKLKYNKLVMERYLENFETEKLKQSRTGYTNLEIDSV